ncbi:hypothetical protein Tco_0451834 [Tanacetum coccineum]
MDNPNITMEEYIRLEEEKARKHGKVFNWETATDGKIWDNEDVYDLGFVETEFPAIVFNDTLTSEATLLCEPTVSSLNENEIDFRILFDESKDEDYMVIYDKNSFSYKIISVNDLKTDSKNDSEKVNMPSFLSPEPTVNCFDDLDFFKDFENEFPAIVYNDDLTSKLDFLTEPTVSPQHMDEFNLKDETSLSESVNNSNFTKKVNTIKGTRVNTARPKVVLRAVKGNKGNAVKALAYFKLTNKSHVLLKVPRKDNMYSVDLKNVVPQGGLTCLYAKDTPVESNLWHRRLGHV